MTDWIELKVNFKSLYSNGDVVVTSFGNLADNPEMRPIGHCPNHERAINQEGADPLVRLGCKFQIRQTETQRWFVRKIHAFDDYVSVEVVIEVVDPAGNIIYGLAQLRSIEYPMLNSLRTLKIDN